MKRAILALGASAAMLLSGCVTNGSRLLPSARSPFIRTLQKGVASNEAGAAGWIYVSDPVANQVNVYPLAGRNQRPIATLTKGIDGPAGLAADSAGNVYVANTLKNTVTEYRRNGAAPVMTYSKDLLGPVDVAVDSKGTVYVANFYSFGNSIVEFPAGNAKPSLEIRNPCSCYPAGLTLDTHDKLYVAYQDFYSQPSVWAYARGSAKAVERDLNFRSIRWLTAGLLLDKAGNLLATNGSVPGVQVFRPAKKNPSKVFARRGSPQFIQFDADQRDVYVTNSAQDAVEEYSYPAGALVDTIKEGLQSAYGIAVTSASEPSRPGAFP
jgi:serine/threonine-protein kinase